VGVLKLTKLPEKKENKLVKKSEKKEKFSKKKIEIRQTSDPPKKKPNK